MCVFRVCVCVCVCVFVCVFVCFSSLKSCCVSEMPFLWRLWITLNKNMTIESCIDNSYNQVCWVTHTNTHKHTQTHTNTHKHTQT